jgi:16S rRNA (guanine966-N2)-methyltransferase
MMRIIAGTLKGRIIPFNNRAFGGAETTQQRTKEALFSILGPGLTGARFLDLYACSGQMGLEAASRGCSLVIMNEPDAARYAFIRDMVRELGIEGCVRVSRMSDVKCVSVLAGEGLRFEFVFIDPPYEKKRGGEGRYGEILDMIVKASILEPGARVVVQHFEHNAIPDKCGNLAIEESRRYGSSRLSFYRMVDGDV